MGQNATSAFHGEKAIDLNFANSLQLAVQLQSINSFWFYSSRLVPLAID